MILLLGLLAVLTSAANSSYKFRIHRDFLEEVFSKNLRVVLEHTDAVQVTRAYLPDVDSYLDDVSLRIVPADASKDVEVDILMEAGDNRIILDMKNLEFKGSAKVYDPVTSEVIEHLLIETPFESSNIHLSFGRLKTSLGHDIPSVDVDSVKLVLSSAVSVSGLREIQMYKTHGFERAIF